MPALIPSAIRALAHRRMVLSALRANSSLSVRLARYNAHMTIVRTLETLGGCAMSQPIARLADEALELLRATHERISNMRVLFNAITKDLKHGKSHDIEELASLGSFLAFCSGQLPGCPRNLKPEQTFHAWLPLHWYWIFSLLNLPIFTRP